MSKPSPHRRRGFSIIAVLALFVLTGSLLTVWARDALQQHQQTQLAHQRTQAEWLATSALARAAARHAAVDQDDGDRDDIQQYDGEVWKLSPAELGQAYAAEVTITVDAEADPRLVTAVVRLSSGDRRLVQLTRAAELEPTNPTTNRPTPSQETPDE